MPQGIIINPALLRSPLLSEPTMPADPTLRAIANDVLAKMKYSFAAVASEEAPEAQGDLDRVYRSLLATRSTQNRQMSRALLASPAPIRVREFGRSADIKAQDYFTFGSNQISAKMGKIPVDSNAVKISLSDMGKKLIKKLASGQMQTDDTLRPGAAGADGTQSRAGAVVPIVGVAPLVRPLPQRLTCNKD